MICVKLLDGWGEKGTLNQIECFTVLIPILV